jgi:hypothetical protein
MKRSGTNLNINWLQNSTTLSRPKILQFNDYLLK